MFLCLCTKFLASCVWLYPLGRLVCALEAKELFECARLHRFLEFIVALTNRNRT